VSTLTEIRRAVASQLSELPCAVKVALGEANYDNDPAKRLIVGVTVGPPSPEAEELLDILLEPDGEHSVRATLEANVSLGGVVAEVYVIGHSGYRIYPSPDGPVLGAEFKLDYVA